MFDDILLTPIKDIKKEEDSMSKDELFIGFLNRLEGWKTKCKNLHWSAPKKNIHVYLDDFLTVISDYQDSLAEEYMGINGKIMPNAIKGIVSEVLNAGDFINEIKQFTCKFYDSIPSEGCYAGIRSECETFIHNILKYNYLFSLCDIRPY